MTTYDSNMTSSTQIPMPELYKFSRGFDKWYYTSYKTELVFEGSIYHAAAIKRGPFEYTSDLSVSRTTLTASILDEFTNYIASQPPERTSVVIYRAMSDDLTKFAPIFDGNVVSISFNEDNIVQAGIVQKSSILDRELVMIYHSATCNHHVFRGNCGADQLLHRVYTSVAVSGGDLISLDFASKDDGYFTGGQVNFDSDTRLITNHVGDTITLHVPFDSRLSNGEYVEALAGCDLLPSTCINKFDNFDDFLGTPYIPSKNPAIWGV